MEAQQLHRGRLIDHVHLIARDIEVTKRFYVAALGALGRKIEGEGEGYFWSDETFRQRRDAMSTTGATHVHLAFQAPDRATVDRFYAAALAAGGKDHGKPGVREQYHAGYYARVCASIPMATTSRRFITARRRDRPNRLS